MEVEPIYLAVNVTRVYSERTVKKESEGSAVGEHMASFHSATLRT